MEKDLSKKRCLMDNERYADLINGLLLAGKQKVQACDLQELDAQSSIYGIWKSGSQRRYRQLSRDVVKKAAFGVNFAVIGVENQEEVHYLMPIRAMEYDAAEYERQARIVRKRIRKEKGISKAEFLSGFRRGGKLIPCITIILFFGEEWDGSRNLHEMLDFTDIPIELREYTNNYHIHVFEVTKLENTEVFKTDLKNIFDFIRCSRDKRKLKELIQNNPAYQDMDEDAYDMAVAYADAKELLAVKKYHGKDGKVNMCKGLQEWMDEERQAGLEQGIEQGIEQFILDNLEEGIPEARIVEKLMRRFSASEEKAQEYIAKYK